MKLDRVIARRLAEHAHRVRCPMRYEHIVRWLLLQHPRLAREAVGRTLCRLAAIGFVEVDARGWSVRPPESRTQAAREHRNGWNPQQGRAG